MNLKFHFISSRELLKLIHLQLYQKKIIFNDILVKKQAIFRNIVNLYSWNSKRVWRRTRHVSLPIYPVDHHHHDQAFEGGNEPKRQIGTAPSLALAFESVQTLRRELQGSYSPKLHKSEKKQPEGVPPYTILPPKNHIQEEKKARKSTKLQL